MGAIEENSDWEKSLNQILLNIFKAGKRISVDGHQ